MKAGEKDSIQFDQQDFSLDDVTVLFWKDGKNTAIEIDEKGLDFHYPSAGSYVIDVTIETDRGTAQYVGNISVEDDEMMAPHQKVEKQMKERMNLNVHIPEHPKYVIRTAGFQYKINSDLEPTNELNNLYVDYSLKVNERLNIDRVQPGVELFIDEQFKAFPVITLRIGPGVMEKLPYYDGEFKVKDTVVYYSSGTGENEMYAFDIQLEDRWFEIRYELIDGNTFEDAKAFVVNFVEENSKM